jgi:type I restriction enzyme S subunit
MKTGWEEKRLGDVLQLEYGKPLDRVMRKPDGLYPVYGANGEINRSDKFYVDKPSIIVGRKGSAGEINLTDVKFWPLDVTYVVTFDAQQYDLRFLYYLFTNLELPRLAKGVKPGINRNEVYSLAAKFPPLPEQQRLVRLLDEAFDRIATAKAKAQKNLQNAHVLFESYLETVFTQRGEGWIEKPLGNLASCRNGINYTKDSKGECVKIVGVRNFQNYFWVPLDDLDTVTSDGELNKLDVLKKDDILTVRSNGNIELIGRCILAGTVSEKITHSGFTIRIRLSSGEILPRYFCHFMKSASSRKRLTDGGVGTNIKSLNQQMLAALVVPFPSYSKQKVIVEKIERLSEETQRLESIYQRKLAALAELKKSLLHHAFNGEL